MEQGISTFTPAIIAAWTLVAIAFLALATLAYVAIRNHARPANLEQAVQAFASLDIEAFRNLVDPAEEAYLRDRLPPAKFRDIKRQRAWAALIYTWDVGNAAKALAIIGQAAQRSANPEIAASGVQVAENALRLRLQTIHAGFHLLGDVLLPGLKSGTLPPLFDQYRRSAETLLRLDGFSSGVRLSHSKSA